VSEELLKEEIFRLNKKIEKLNEEYRTMEMYLPKVFARKKAVVGRQLTRLNYTVGNKLAELNNLNAEHQ